MKLSVSAVVAALFLAPLVVAENEEGYEIVPRRLRAIPQGYRLKDVLKAKGATSANSNPNNDRELVVDEDHRMLSSRFLAVDEDHRMLSSRFLAADEDHRMLSSRFLAADEDHRMLSSRFLAADEDHRMLSSRFLADDEDRRM